MKNSYFVAFILMMAFISTEIFAQTDTVVVGFEDFIKVVQSNHPVAKQGELILRSGEVNMMKARGSFDPVIKSEYDQKQFDGKI